MRLIYLGSGEFGLPTLQRLHVDHEVVAVISQPDKPAGRKRKLTPTPIAAWAESNGLNVLKCPDVNTDEFITRAAQLNADASVVIAFGQKLSPSFIDALGRLVINLHASLLPRHRGAAPINSAIISGDEETGLSVIALAQRMDAGLVYGMVSTPIDPNEIAGELHDRLSLMGPDVIEKVLGEFQSGALNGEEQDETLATRAPKLSKKDSTVDFNTSAVQVRNRIHGLTPWPGVSVNWNRRDAGDQVLKICRVAAEPGSLTDVAPGTVLHDCRVAVADGAIKLIEVQVPGGRVMKVEDFIHGHPIRPGDFLRSEI